MCRLCWRGGRRLCSFDSVGVGAANRFPMIGIRGVEAFGGGIIGSVVWVLGANDCVRHFVQKLTHNAQQ